MTTLREAVANLIKVKGRHNTEIAYQKLVEAFDADKPEQEPVAWVETLENAQPHCVTDLKYCSVMQHERGEHLKYIPLYTAPPKILCGCGDQIMPDDGAECGNCVTARNAVKEWVGLTKEEAREISLANRPYVVDMIAALEARLKEKNT